MRGEDLAKLLDHCRVSSGADRFPILWSETSLDDLRRLAVGEIAPPSAVDTELAVAFLECTTGKFAQAEQTILDSLRRNLEACTSDNETFISFIKALFVVQRFDLVAALLRARYGFARELRIEARRDGPGQGRVRWTILPSGAHRFTFDAKTFENDKTRQEILTFQWQFPLYANYARLADQEVGSVVINQEDVGETPGLAWCDSRPDYFLLPDPVFVPTQGYRYARQVFRDKHVAWEARARVAFWRGSTTGVPARPGEWRTLDRLRLCELARRYSDTNPSYSPHSRDSQTGMVQTSEIA